MNLLKREHARESGSDPCSYAPIARALHRISDSEKDQLQHKFDIAYFTAVKKKIQLPLEVHTQMKLLENISHTT